MEIWRGPGLPADQRRQSRATHVAPLVEALEAWMRPERARLSRHNPVAKAMDYMLTRWPAFARFLTDGRICLTNNAAERELRAVALGRKNWTFYGSDRGGERAAAIYTLMATAKLNGIDPRPDSPTSCAASTIIRYPGSTSCCPGTGPSRSPTKPQPPKARSTRVVGPLALPDGTTAIDGRWPSADGYGREAVTKDDAPDLLASGVVGACYPVPGSSDRCTESRASAGARKYRMMAR